MYPESISTTAAAEDMRVNQITQEEWEEHEGLNRRYLRTDRGDRCCADGWEKSTTEVEGKLRYSNIIKTKGVSRKTVSNFPLNSGSPWSQLQWK